MKNTKIIIKTKSKSYPIYFGNKILNSIKVLVKKNLPDTKKISIISDKNLPGYLIKKIVKSLKIYNPKVYKLNSNEKIKNFKVANKLIEKLLKDNLNRSDCVIALGGGVISDLTAFVASVTKRGIGFINIPTTLLSQVDASIGGKTGVNSNQGKNLIGTFYQPNFVLIDISTLETLPHREMICGYAEILKHSLIQDKKFFIFLNKNAKKILNKKDKTLLKKAILKSCRIKCRVVQKDEKEKDLRMILNFGHTFAHAYEATLKYSGKLNHGEAVILGIISAIKFSYLNLFLKKKNYNEIFKHINSLNLKIDVNNFFNKKDIKSIIDFMKLDKKNKSTKINLVLLKKIGKPIINLNFNFNKIESFLKKELIN